MSLFAHLLIGAAGVTWLTLPGWLLARKVNLPYPSIAGFIAGTLGLLTVILACQVFLGVLSPGTVVGSWAAISLGAYLLQTHLTPLPKSAPATPTSSQTDRACNLLLWFALIPVLTVVVWRVSVHPLFGVDTSFRWNYLAELMFTQQNLDFYPPTQAAHYSLYPWPDGIAPLVSSLYYFNYLLAGSPAPTLTSSVILVQFGLLMFGVHALSRRYFSASAGRFAVVIFAVTPMAVWSSTMGQETGLTALALVAMLLYLPNNRAEENTPGIIMAAIAAAAGATAREYGWSFLVLGFALGATRKLSPRALFQFTAVAVFAAAPWYVRNAVLTGNAFFNLDLIGLLPVNEPHTALMALYRQHYDFSSAWKAEHHLLTATCLAALLGLGAGILVFRKQALELLAAALLIGVLWWASVAYTAAGFLYSLRVLSPALAIGAVLGGGACAHWFVHRPRLRLAASIALFFAAADAAIRVLVLPSNPYVHQPKDWIQIDNAMQAFQNRPIYSEIASKVTGERILVFGPHTELIKTGLRVVPTWSPEVSFLFTANETAASSAQHLIRLGIRHVVVSKGFVNSRYLLLSPFFREAPAYLRPMTAQEEICLYEIVIPPS